MMLELDMLALNERFAEMVVDDSQLIVTNDLPDLNLDRSRIYCRFVIDPGASQRIEQGPNATWEQQGVVILQIIAPYGTREQAAYAFREQFARLFRDWRSPDKKLFCVGITNAKFEQPAQNDQPAYLQLDCRVFWRSRRIPD